ncbi:hypothetical protein VPH35_099909 [Triticum aestivum]
MRQKRYANRGSRKCRQRIRRTPSSRHSSSSGSSAEDGDNVDSRKQTTRFRRQNASSHVVAVGSANQPPSVLRGATMPVGMTVRGSSNELSSQGLQLQLEERARLQQCVLQQERRCIHGWERIGVAVPAQIDWKANLWGIHKSTNRRSSVGGDW